MPGEGLIQRSPQTRRAWAWPTSGGSPGAVLLGFSHLGPLRELRPLHLAIDRPWRRRSISAACSSCAGANPAATDKAILLIVERVLPEKAVPGLAADFLSHRPRNACECSGRTRTDRGRVPRHCHGRRCKRRSFWSPKRSIQRAAFCGGKIPFPKCAGWAERDSECRMPDGGAILGLRLAGRG